MQRACGSSVSYAISESTAICIGGAISSSLVPISTTWVRQPRAISARISPAARRARTVPKAARHRLGARWRQVARESDRVRTTLARQSGIAGSNMPIHEKSLIEPDHLVTAEKLVVDGVDVSGHWNTMILPRQITDYDTDFYRTIQAYGGGENVHRCWQCGSALTPAPCMRSMPTSIRATGSTSSISACSRKYSRTRRSSGSVSRATSAPTSAPRMSGPRA